MDKEAILGLIKEGTKEEIEKVASAIVEDKLNTTLDERIAELESRQRQEVKDKVYPHLNRPFLHLRGGEIGQRRLQGMGVRIYVEAVTVVVSCVDYGNPVSHTYAFYVIGTVLVARRHGVPHVTATQIVPCSESGKVHAQPFQPPFGKDPRDLTSKGRIKGFIVEMG